MEKSREFLQLIELVGIVTKYKIRQIEIVINPKSKEGTPSNYWKLYNAIIEGKVKNDDEAAAYFKLASKDRKYRRLRNELISRLINTLFFINVADSDTPVFNTTFYDCIKDYASMRMLYSRGALTSSFEMGKALISKAIKNDFCEIVAGTAQILQLYYSRYDPDPIAFEKHRELALTYHERRKNEMLIQGVLMKITMPMVNAKAEKINSALDVKTHIKEFEEIPDKFRSRNFMTILFRLKVTNSLVIKGWQNTIATCSEAIAYFDSIGYEKPKRTFYLQKSMAEIMVKSFDNAEESIEHCLSLTQTGSGNWFKLKEMKMMSFLHSRKYKLAFELNNEVKSHPRRDAILSVDKEIWLLYDAYIHLLIASGQINIDEKKNKIKKFRLSKFLNEVPIYSKDKKGMNVPIILLQFFFLVLDGRFDEAQYKFEAIQKYAQRHLKNRESSFRTNCFIRMTGAIVKAGFDKKGAIAKAERWKQQLSSQSLNLLEQIDEVEIIPYEDLWEISLVCLEIGLKK